MNGIRIRFETNPGRSRASAGVLPRSIASSTIALDGTARGVIQRDAAAGRRDDLRDARAHLTCAHDEDMLESHRAPGYRRAIRRDGLSSSSALRHVPVRRVNDAVDVPAAHCDYE